MKKQLYRIYNFATLEDRIQGKLIDEFLDYEEESALMEMDYSFGNFLSEEGLTGCELEWSDWGEHSFIKYADVNQTLIDKVSKDLKLSKEEQKVAEEYEDDFSIVNGNVICGRMPDVEDEEVVINKIIKELERVVDYIVDESAEAAKTAEPTEDEAILELSDYYYSQDGDSLRTIFDIVHYESGKK